MLGGAGPAVMPHPSPRDHETSPTRETGRAFRRGLLALHRQHEHDSLTFDQSVVYDTIDM
jgi:hypothetical protein